jgi:L,D-peptidoglycan transpeptidase YkuD (ErfK/YbiS/YcfS/YnhG family)
MGEPIAIVVGSRCVGWVSASSPLVTAFGHAAQPPTGIKVPYLVLTPSIECVDDALSKNYNRIVDRSMIASD